MCHAYAQNQPATLQPDVVPIPDDGSVIISNVTPSSITLSGKVPELKPGNVIAGGPAPGIMRRIISLTQSGDRVMLKTKDAAMTEVFKSVHLHFNGPIQFGEPTWKYGDPPMKSDKAAPIVEVKPKDLPPLSVLRSYTGSVTDGALTLTDPQTRANVQLSHGLFQNGIPLTFTVWNGAMPTLANDPSIANDPTIRLSPTVYSITFDPSGFGKNTLFTFNLPDLPKPSLFGRVCIATFAMADAPTINMPNWSIDYVTAENGLVKCPVDSRLFASKLIKGRETIYMSVIDFNLPK